MRKATPLYTSKLRDRAGTFHFFLQLTITLAAAAGAAGILAASGLVAAGTGVLGPNLDAVCLVVDVENALLDFVVDLPVMRTMYIKCFAIFCVEHENEKDVLQSFYNQ